MTKILDHGYVELIETWGSDERVIESARMSTGKGFKGWGPICVECGWPQGDEHEAGCSLPERWKAGDEKLLRYLYENGHMTPFEMAGATLEIGAPIMVFREWHRHRTQAYNEMSARYTPLPNENYSPSLDRMLIGSDGKNKQAGTIAGAGVLTMDTAAAWLVRLEESYNLAERVYQEGLIAGVPKELARLPLPVGRYSRMRASANLRNWLGFCTLRTTAKNPAAQWEIRQFADEVCAQLSVQFPRTLALFNGE
jgi:thymidylate synthase (FAD)